KEELRNEGLFSQERKRALPAYPKTIGLITADNSDAKKDFETHLGNYGFKIYFYDVRVEGLKSAENVVQAIKYFNENFTDVDILTITRGGGSLESLQAFNSEGVARAVFSSRIPVVSAIGHERNFTICDMVADVRASTPTDAGKIVSKDWREASQILSQAKKDIFSAYNIALISYREYLDLQAERMSRAFKSSVVETRNKIENVGANILRESEHLINQNKQKLEYLGRVLDAMNPEKKLQQGYAIVRTLSGKVVRSANSVGEGDIIKTQFFDGNIESKVGVKS
ncbi:MAG TPA: exodeoxyribonuclease VII large subunit, partial [bacterium]|nr:exodeoxyribonuclease VII large subunit [bacterium]